MRIGLISDMHLGFTRGTKTQNEVNVREQDFIDAARLAVQNLLEAEVNVIVDAGDMAEVAAPKKRAVLALIDIIRESETLWFSANGNHTLQRTRSDLHLYDVLGAMCSNFAGYVTPTYVQKLNGIFIPYSTASSITESLAVLLDEHPDAAFVVGHWSAEDAPYPGDHVSLGDLPRGIPTFLGHYHRRQIGELDPRQLNVFDLNEIGDRPYPIYIGATERSKWNEWDNPTGVAVWDTDTGLLEFIEHHTRPWIDLHADAENYMEVVDRDIEGAIVRLTINASREQYKSLDLVGLRRKARELDPLEFEVRRVSEKTKEVASPSEATFSLKDDWAAHIKNARLAKGVDRTLVKQIGEDALAMAGGFAA